MGPTADVNQWDQQPQSQFHGHRHRPRPTGNHRPSVLPRDFTISQNISSALIRGAVRTAHSSAACVHRRARHRRRQRQRSITMKPQPAICCSPALIDIHQAALPAVEPTRTALIHTPTRREHHPPTFTAASPLQPRGALTARRRVRRAAAHELIVRSCRRFLGHARCRRGRELSERAMPTNG